MESSGEIYLAGGCFWGTEHFFKQVNGVTDTETGYANGKMENPSYANVCTGNTGYAEAVKIVYDKNIAPLWFLLDLFYLTIDPTSLNHQGNDMGTQYRTGIYYTDDADKEVVEASIKKLKNKVSEPVQIEVGKLKNFYYAENMHQDYLRKNTYGYCHIDRSLFELAKNAVPNEKRKEESYKKEPLTEEQYKVTQYGCTERAYNNAYWNCFDDGLYVDIISGEPLFTSKEKFFSDCGWPSFSKTINQSQIKEKKDTTNKMVRMEVKGTQSGSHLGHIFDDGPEDMGGLRYCINSAAIDFVPKADMEKRGYGKFLSLFE